MARLFKEKYIIAIYELNGTETCVGQFDNVRQLAKYINKSVGKTQRLVCNHFRNRFSDTPRKICVDDELYEIAFINVA